MLKNFQQSDYSIKDFKIRVNFRKFATLFKLITFRLMAFDIEMIRKVYDQIAERVDKARTLTGKPLTLSEKILYAHLWDGTPSKEFQRGKDYVDFAPDLSLIHI